MKIDHIGIAVKSLADAVKVYEQAVGLTLAGYDEVEEQGVRVAMLDIGESRIELVEPTRPDSPIEKFMAKRGEGIHHIAVRWTTSRTRSRYSKPRASGSSTKRPGAGPTIPGLRSCTRRPPTAC